MQNELYSIQLYLLLLKLVFLCRILNRLNRLAIGVVVKQSRIEAEWMCLARRQSTENVNNCQCWYTYDANGNRTARASNAIHNNNVVIIDGRVPHSILIEVLTDEGVGTQFK